MQFARVSGTIVLSDPEGNQFDGSGRLIVTLDTGRHVATVRDEVVQLLPTPDGSSEVAWSADQYTQETIAVDLAELGWEVFGIAADGSGDAGPATSGVSETYLVRRLSSPAEPTNGSDSGR